MPVHRKVRDLYNICLAQIYKNIVQYIDWLDKRCTCNKSAKLKRVNQFLLATLPKRILDDILDYNAAHCRDNWDPLAQYSFFVATVHNHVTKFHAKNIDLKISYWECLMQDNFSHIKVLDFACCCNDLILELIGKHCPAVEYLNATSKYNRFHDETRDPHLRIPVTDKGLAHLSQCKLLKKLIINEPKGALTRFGGRVWSNEITFDGLRCLLKSVKSLEELSYTDIGSLISHNFEEVDKLNLKVIAQINPTENSLCEILRLCENLEHLSLSSDAELTCQPIQTLCSSSIKLKEVRFQNLCFGKYFESFYTKFGETLVDITLSYDEYHDEEITFLNFVTIGYHCPNIKSFACTKLAAKNNLIIVPRELAHKPFSQLERLALKGENIDVVNFLSYCTEYADNFQVLKLDEKRTYTDMDELFLKCVKTTNIRHVELSRRLPCSKFGIQQIINHYPKLGYLKIYCSENCDELIREYNSMNYEFRLIVKERQNDALWIY